MAGVSVYGIALEFICFTTRLLCRCFAEGSELLRLMVVIEDMVSAFNALRLHRKKSGIKNLTSN